ncbi:MAG: putative diguanylate cyclase [Methanocella sp. PtaU1.Bin125]|nr:MAG: putative diguanylate cyclase [Methanocella sp. PtaU1.Bin125]
MYNIVLDNTDNLEKIFSGKIDSIIFDTTLMRKGGEKTAYELNMRRVAFKNMEYVVTIARDITGRKRAEAELRESEEKFRALTESSAAGIVLYQDEWLVSVNPAAERITGYSKDELLEMRLFDIVHPDYREVVLKRARARQRGEPEPSQYETMIITKRGEARWVLLSVGLMSYRGKPAGVVTLLDITVRKQAEEALRKSEARLARSQKIARLGSYDWDLVHNTDEWSDELYYIMGIRPGDVKPSLEAFMRFVYPDDRMKVHKHLDDIFNKQIFVGGYEVRIVRSDGLIRWIKLDGEFECDESGNVARIFGTVMDITERKRAEEQLSESKRQAELYLDLMSHDITNMNQALMGYLEIMEVMQESGKIDKVLIDNSIEVINRSSRMIGDVKKLTRLQAGDVIRKEVDLCTVLSTVKARHSSVPNRQVTINYTRGKDCLVIASDLLEDVFDNLVDNAIRHSTGPVTIDITVDRVIHDGHWYFRIIVTDTGPGIPDELKKKIFVTIREIAAGEKRERRGFGLYLVWTLIDYYHGKVWVEDRVPGDHTKGARFVVMLPVIEK